MQIVFDAGGRRREFDIQVNHPAATVADLAMALDPVHGSERRLYIADQPVQGDHMLREAGLHEGALVHLDPIDPNVPAPPAIPGPPQHPELNEPQRELVIVNGIDAGQRFTLSEGGTLVGRSRDCDIVLENSTVSLRHCQFTLEWDDDDEALEVTVTDFDSHNGTWVGDEAVTEPTVVPEGTLVRLGALHLEIRDIVDDDQPIAIDPLRNTNAAGMIPFNRPPRPAPPPPIERVEGPMPPKPSQTSSGFSIISIIAPLIFAGAMYAVIRQPYFLMIAGLSPVMAIGNAVDSKRKGKKSRRSENERFERELVEFKETLVVTAERQKVRDHADFPDPAEVLRRATLPSTRLWERRPQHQDFLRLRAGVGDIDWRPPVDEKKGTAKVPESLTEAIKDASMLTDGIVPVDVSGGGVVGIVGDRSAALALTRSLLCQAATFHGPADMPVMVLASEENYREWDWAKWLPHVRDLGGMTRMLSNNSDMSTRFVEGRLKAASGDDKRPRRAPGEDQPTGPTLLVVVDDESLTSGRKAPTRSLLRGEGELVAGIVIASTVDRLPAVCTTVVDLKNPDGEAQLFLPQRGKRVDSMLACGVTSETARECARRLARFEDPELDVVGSGLPTSIRLLPLLELEDCTPEAVLARWAAGGVDPSPATPVGVTEDGVFSIDFMSDGPHALVGGTTGAGKSELLRTLVAGLAATVDPDHLTFVLVDFKGGSAFDECARLPHTVGMVTDLDEHLAERALRCLEAELKYRERVLRDAAAIDLPDYLRNNKGTEPLPRLLVIIDEFATLKAELPDFVDALVGVAQRGRSLGVHMLLATQRPQGAISDNIKANTNLRLALRMQDNSDSSDVIGVNDAAKIPRSAPGRAYVRLGHDEIVAFQSALSTGARGEGTGLPIELAPFIYGPNPRLQLMMDTGGNGADEPEGAAAEEETDLKVLVGAINAAFQRTQRPLPRRPWPEPLPAELDLDQLIDDALAKAPDGRSDFVPIALADDPDAQAQYPVGWTKADGNLLAYGLVGSGTTTMVTSLTLALARLNPPDKLHFYAVDYGAGELAALQDLWHCGGVVMANERERQQRLLRMLKGELDWRRQLTKADRAELPTVVTIVDGWPAFVADYQDIAGQDLMDSFIRVFSDGPEVGLNVVLVADRGGGISHLISATARQRWAFRMADPNDYSVVGVNPRAVPSMLPGHALMSETKRLVHVARPPIPLHEAVQKLRASTPPPRPERAPEPLRSLPSQVSVDDLGVKAQLQKRPWVIPIGMAEHDLQPVSLHIYEGEHTSILGPARSGKSTTLLAISRAVLAAEPNTNVVAVCDQRSPLMSDPCVRHVVDPSDIDQLPELVRDDAPAVLVLVDDVERIADSRLEPLGTSRRGNLLVVAAGRADILRTDHGHWTRAMRRSKLGIMLKPDPDVDGLLLGTQLPRRPPVPITVGRGYVVTGGESVLAQMAVPDGVLSVEQT